MSLPRFIVASVCSVSMMVLGAGGVSGQDFPNKPLRVVAPSLGGGPDFVARLVAQWISISLGQSVFVDNRVSIAAAEFVSKALPDGYTLLIIGNNFWIGPLLQKKPYDPVADFLPITMATSTPSLLVVHPSLPVKFVKELIVLAKARPGELNYAGESIGSSGHLAAESFKALAALNIVRIPYKGAGPAINGLIGGEAQLMFPTAAAVTPHVNSGRLRALAIASAEPSALVPGLPTVAASGLPGFEANSFFGIFAPAKTPATVMNRLHLEIVRALKRPDVKEKLFNAGIDIVGSSQEQAAGTIKSEMVRLGKVIRDAGIRED